MLTLCVLHQDFFTFRHNLRAPRQPHTATQYIANGQAGQEASACHPHLHRPTNPVSFQGLQKVARAELVNKHTNENNRAYHQRELTKEGKALLATWHQGALEQGCLMTKHSPPNICRCYIQLGAFGPKQTRRVGRRTALPERVPLPDTLLHFTSRKLLLWLQLNQLQLALRLSA